MRNVRAGLWAVAVSLLSLVVLLSSCRSGRAPDGSEKNPPQELCNCPKGVAKQETEARAFLKDALLPRGWNATERQAALEEVRDYREGFFSGPGGSWGSCQFQISDDLLAKILADKEARAKKKEFDYRTDTPQEAFRTWFDTPALGLFENKKHVLETCELTWWGAASHPGEYFRSWERMNQAPRWSVVVKVCPMEQGMRWVFFRCTAE